MVVVVVGCCLWSAQESLHGQSSGKDKAPNFAHLATLSLRMVKLHPGENWDAREQNTLASPSAAPPGRWYLVNVLVPFACIPVPAGMELDYSQGEGAEMGISQGLPATPPGQPSLQQFLSCLAHAFV